MIVEWDKLPQSCRDAATLWAKEYGDYVVPAKLQDITVAVAVGLYIANLGGHKDVRAEQQRAIVEANDALLEVECGDHEHIIQCHADTLPEMYRALAKAHEKAVDILQVEIHAMLDRGAQQKMLAGRRLCEACSTAGGELRMDIFHEAGEPCPRDQPKGLD